MTEYDSERTNPSPELEWKCGTDCYFSARGCGKSDRQFNTYDYLASVPGNEHTTDWVEVQFKNTRKGYYRNDNRLKLKKGDMVSVEASPGHDVGVVTLTGQLVLLQLAKISPKETGEIKRVYRIARETDLAKYEEAKLREHDTMIRSRKIAKDMGLDMKIGDVEYQGDGAKAIFYYIADQRVDFRQLIKVLAEEFRVRIEMRQIGARQEAGRIGGIGPCGRELCCATWMKNFKSVGTAAVRYQDISPNPQKLAGQCAKLKCCLNYEVDAYMEAFRQLPAREVSLETADSTYYYFKADILSGNVTYSTDRRLAANLAVITAERAKEVIRLNRQGEKPALLDDRAPLEAPKRFDLAEQDDLTRFDKVKRKKKKNKHKKPADMAAATGSAAGEPRQGRSRRNAKGQHDKRDDKPSGAAVPPASSEQ